MTHIVVRLPPQSDITRSLFYIRQAADACKMPKTRAVNPTGDGEPQSARPPFAVRKTIPAQIFFNYFGIPQNNSSGPSPTVKARFERVLASAPRSPLYMVISSALDVALETPKLCLSNATHLTVGT
jgi:hypothetical protein